MEQFNAQTEIRRQVPEIEHGIPMPRAVTSKMRWNFSAMNPGDSFFDTAHPKTIMNAAKAWRLRNDPKVKFSHRSVIENGVKGVRVWRIL